MITIVSCGSPGVDRGAMDAAIRLGLDYTGCAPAGFDAPAIYATHLCASSCITYARQAGDAVCERFAELLLTLSDERRKAWLGSTYCARCLHDITPSDGRPYCMCPEGPKA